MADLFCGFLYFRSPTTNYNLPLFLPPRQYFTSALHSHNSRISRIERRSPHLPLLFKPSPFAASASGIDVISAQEGADGSFLFRFGEPSEVGKNVEVEEPKIVKDEIEGEDTNGSILVNVIEGEDESEVTTSGSTEASDRADSIVSSSNTLIAVEGESESSEKLLAVAVDTELPVSTSDKEMGGISSPDLDIEQIGLNEEYKDLSSVEASIPDESSQIENTIVEVSYEESLEETSKVTCTSKEVEIPSVEECPNKEDVDSPADASTLDQSCEVVDNITTVALLEKESDGICSADVDADQTGKVVEGLDEVYEDFPVNAPVLDKSSEEVNGIFAEVLLEKETDGNTSTSDIELEPTGNVEEGINEVCEDSPVDGTSAPDNITAALSEKETADITSAPDIDIEFAGNVEQGVDEDYEDSPVDASFHDKSSEVVNGISAEVLLEKETNGDTSTSDIEIEPTGNVEEGINEECEDSPVDTTSAPDNTTAALSENETATDIEIECTGNVEQGLDGVLEEPSLVEKRPEVENCITAQELLEEKPADATTSVALETEPVVSELDTGAGQGGLETAVTPTAVPISEFQNAVTAIHDETIGDGRESFDNNLVSPSSQPEPAMSLYKETEVPNLQADVRNLATKESSETDVNNIKAVEMQNVLSNDNESDMYGAEDKSATTEPDMTWSIGSEEQASGSGSGVPSETAGHLSEKDAIQLLTVSPQLEADSMLEEETVTETVEVLKEDDESRNQAVGGGLAEASVHEVTAPESTESKLTSQEKLMTDFVLSSGAALLLHPSKVLTGGEDAYFIADETWFGVADGVSQWSLEGTTQGVYAQALIKNCEKLISECRGNSINNPIELLNLSVAQTHSPGSSTVLIAQFDGQALHVANVGNSGFIILRHGAVYKRSSPMHHVFSFPVRIERGDNPYCLAQLYRVDLEEKDIVVIATDGLLDNVYDKEISLIAMKSLSNDKNPKEIAELLAKKAQEVGSSACARSPFADDAQAAGFPGYSGGKLDDVAVIVSVVQRR